MRWFTENTGRDRPRNAYGLSCRVSHANFGAICPAVHSGRWHMENPGISLNRSDYDGEILPVTTRKSPKIADDRCRFPWILRCHVWSEGKQTVIGTVQEGCWKAPKNWRKVTYRVDSDATLDPECVCSFHSSKSLYQSQTWSSDSQQEDATAAESEEVMS